MTAVISICKVTSDPSSCSVTRRYGTGESKEFFVRSPNLLLPILWTGTYGNADG